jgi:hypothetical protein
MPPSRSATFSRKESCGDTSFEKVPVRFALALDAIPSAAYAHSAEKLPFHVVLGPVHGEMNTLIDLLKVADRFCASCRYGRA